MNRSAFDEYEEVESPFASKKTEKSPSRERIRNRKNVFNRPFATDSTQAPTYFETTATRRSISHGEADFIESRQSELDQTEIEYLDAEEEEEEVIETRPARTTSRSPARSAKKKSQLKKNLLAKVGWSVIGLLVLRLICMDRGVWDYFSTENTIQEKRTELASIHKENAGLKTEITRIQVDKNFQRQLAKEHLGVIAADEFLILFAGESNEVTETNSQASL